MPAPRSFRSARRYGTTLSVVLPLTLCALDVAHGQVAVTFQGGIHSARLDRPERRLEDPAIGLGMEGAKGEATTFGLRLGTWWSDRWGLDAGVAWSRNRSWQGGGVGPVPPDFRTNTIFTSATLRARLTPGASAWELVAGAGPAVILHAGSGSSLLTRDADLGGLLSVSGSVRVAPRLALAVDAQQYLFSSSFAESYYDFVAGEVRPAGSQFRRELVLLAGLAWQIR